MKTLFAFTAGIALGFISGRVWSVMPLVFGFAAGALIPDSTVSYAVGYVTAHPLMAAAVSLGVTVCAACVYSVARAMSPTAEKEAHTCGR